MMTPGAIAGRRSVLAIGLTAMALAGCAAGTQTPGNAPNHPRGSGAATDAAAVSTTGFPSGTGQPGIFTDRCGYSHQAADDPILAPGHPGTAMHHNFFGNTATSASSTGASLVGGPTTCSTSADSSAYWTPVLYQNGKALTPSTALIYWRRPKGDSDPVQTIPVGLQMIAGNEAATAPQPKRVTAWTCTKQPGLRTATATPHNCRAGSDLRLTVTFPSCWDGHTLTGAGQQNVVYRDSSGCPTSHPVQIPQIVFHVSYPTSSASSLTLSMTPTMQGSTDTEHVDFINGWNQKTLTNDVAACTATSTRCGPVTGPAAPPHGPHAMRLRQAHRHHSAKAN